jgi:uncharacterized protein YdiU (UPF0061 family)
MTEKKGSIGNSSGPSDKSISVFDYPQYFRDFKISNHFTEHLAADPEPMNFRREVKDSCFSRVDPVKVANPSIVSWSHSMGRELGIDPSFFDGNLAPQILSGNVLLKEMDPFGMCYGGHQFGHWAGQLGDGRAINLCEAKGPSGRRWMLQLKGAGPTPYSRGADGLAVLRSSIREYLCSEAMFHLGISTTRALSLTLTGDEVIRDKLYDGRRELEPGAIVCRVAESFVRFGNFEIFASRNDKKTLQSLADYCAVHFYGHKLEFAASATSIDGQRKEAYKDMLRQISSRTSSTIVDWMRVGFVHGVMNTDNMSILGQTIDYGPFGWLEDYDSEWTPNTTDFQGRRYAYGRQGQIGHWNFCRLLENFGLLGFEQRELEDLASEFANQYSEKFKAMMLSKLGIDSSKLNSETMKASWSMVESLIEFMRKAKLDWTMFFSQLPLLFEGKPNIDDANSLWPRFHKVLVDSSYFVPDDFSPELIDAVRKWLGSYIDIISHGTRSGIDICLAMRKVNPRYVLRNYLTQEAIEDAEKGDYAKLRRLENMIQSPYTASSELEGFFKKRPDWALNKFGCSMLSCSS